MTKSSDFNAMCFIFIMVFLSFIIFMTIINPSHDYYDEKRFCEESNMTFYDYDTCVKYQDGFELRKDFGKDQNGNLAFKEMKK